LGRVLAEVLKVTARAVTGLELVRALFASMSPGEFESFAQALAGVIERLRAHLAAPGDPP